VHQRQSHDATPVTAVRVRSLFFASYRDLVGAEEIELELPAGSTVAELVAIVRARPGADALPDAPVVAVNHEYVPAETVLRDGDEVAFIPPVAGG
jgi:molybdopterin converting factor subunit 1